MPMWNPEQDETETLDAQKLIDGLLSDEQIRAYCGIKANPDGSYWVGDLDRVKAQSDETKAILRDFLKRYGKRPVDAVPVWRATRELEQTKPYTIQPRVREMLDALYKQIETARLKEPVKKFI